MKYTSTILLAVVLFSCSTEKATLTKPQFSDNKENELFDQQKEPSYVSVVGQAGTLYKEVKDSYARKIREEKEKNISQIQGLNITFEKDANGQNILKGVLNNDILFDFNSFELKEDAKKILDKVYMAVAKGDFIIHITGFTDNVGTVEINKNLSEKRAAAVARYLFDLGLPQNLVTQNGLGSENPISSNNTPEGRTKNRRVEIKFNYNS